MVVRRFMMPPATGTSIALLNFALDHGRFDNMSAAVAYARPSGVDVLDEHLSADTRWRALRQQWLVGIDWCRTHPIALSRLSAFKRTDVRVYDGSRLVVRSGCVPYSAFHP